MKQLSTPFGDLSITVNGSAVDFELNEHFEKDAYNLSGKLRLSVPVEANDEVLCTVAFEEETPISKTD